MENMSLKICDFSIKKLIYFDQVNYFGKVKIGQKYNETLPRLKKIIL